MRGAASTILNDHSILSESLNNTSIVSGEHQSDSRVTGLMFAGNGGNIVEETRRRPRSPPRSPLDMPLSPLVGCIAPRRSLSVSECNQSFTPPKRKNDHGRTPSPRRPTAASKRDKQTNKQTNKQTDGLTD